MPGLSLDTPLDEPLYQGISNATNRDVPGVWQVGIAGHGYIIDPKEFQQMTVPLRRESTDESVEPGEQTLNTSSAWRRSQDNWFLGAGQEFMDNRFAFVSVYVHSGEDPSVRTRFWRSKGVNPWTEGSLSLLPEYTLGQASTGAGKLVVLGSYIYGSVVVGGVQELHQFDNDFSVNNKMNQPTAWGGGTTWPTITAMTTDGANLYLACGSYGVAVLAAGSSTATPLRGVGPTPSGSATGGGTGTTYTYYVVAVDATGAKTLVSAAGTISNAATLDGTHYNTITWAAVPGAVSYDVLKGDTSHLLTSTTLTSATDNTTTTGTAYAAPSATTQNFPATFVLYANGWLLAAAANQLVSIGTNGTNTLVMTHRVPAWTWTAGCGSPMAIYVTGNAGGTSEVYGVQISTTNFALNSPYIASVVTQGEQVNDLIYYEGLVIMATSLGVRTCQDTSQNGHLDTGPVINALGPSNCLSAWGGFVYFGVSNFVENDGVWEGTTTTSGLGRLAISQYSANLIPAYATDVMSTVTGTTTGCCVLNGVPYFSIQGSGAWMPTGNLVPQGWLETGWVRYGTIEDKILVTADVRHAPLNGTIQLQVVPFGGAPYYTAASTVAGSTQPPYHVSAGAAVGEAFMVIPILTRSAADPTKGPVLHRWTCRAMVTSIRQDQILLPIIWKEEDLSPQGDGTPLYLDLAKEWAFLKGLEQDGTAFNLQIGELVFLAFIDQIELKGEKWNDQRTMMTGTLNVKCLTVN